MSNSSTTATTALQAELAELATTVLNFNACRYVTAAGTVILLYDHMLTLNQEVQLIWKARWTIPKGMFLMNRYIVPTMIVINSWQLAGLADPPPSDRFCKVWFTFAIYMGSLSIANGSFIVLLRLWVLWERRTSLVLWTFLVFTVSQLATIGMVTWVVINLVPQLYYSDIVHSCVLSQRIDLDGLWAPGVVFEIMIFATTVYNAMERPRIGSRPLKNQLYRDGFTFFCVLFGLRVLNLMLAIFAPLSLLFLGVFFIWCATNVTVSHLVLNIRNLSEENRLEEQELAVTSTIPPLTPHATGDDEGSRRLMSSWSGLGMGIGAEDIEGGQFRVQSPCTRYPSSIGR